MISRNPLVLAFLSMAGRIFAANNPLAMVAAKGINIDVVKKARKRKGRGTATRRIYRSGGGKVYGANGPQAVARRQRQIARGMLTEANGLVRQA